MRLNIDEEVFADIAYASKKHDKLLAQKNIKNLILKRVYRNKPSIPEEKQNKW